jgi:hypothetical protein
MIENSMTELNYRLRIESKDGEIVMRFPEGIVKGDSLVLEWNGVDSRGRMVDADDEYVLRGTLWSPATCSSIEIDESFGLVASVNLLYISLYQWNGDETYFSPSQEYLRSMLDEWRPIVEKYDLDMQIQSFSTEMPFLRKFTSEISEKRKSKAIDILGPKGAAIRAVACGADCKSPECSAWLCHLISALPDSPKKAVLTRATVLVIE